MRLTMG